MDLTSWSLLAIAAPAVVFAGISKGGFGSGASFLSASILAIVLAPDQALGLMLPLLMLIDAASLKPYWGKWDWRDTKRLLIGSFPGAALGAVFLSLSSAGAVRLLIGVICLGFVGWQLAQARGLIAPPARRMGAGAGIAAGAVMGFTSFVSHAGGPVAAVYLLSQKLGKTAFQATTVIVFWVNNFTKCALYAAMGIFSTEMLTAGLYLVPFALLGTWLGVRLHHLVPERLFFAITYLLLTLTGVKLMWDALG